MFYNYFTKWPEGGRINLLLGAMVGKTLNTGWEVIDEPEN